MPYQLIYMSFDGDYVKDHKGPLEECRNAADNVGSKWFFYPWGIITTEKGCVKEMGGIFYNITLNKPVVHLLFKGKYLKTVQKAFIKTNDYCQKNDLAIGVEEFERLLIAQF